MSKSDDELVKAIVHYQECLEKYAKREDVTKMLYCITKLYKLPVNINHLTETGVGRTVNALRKIGGEVGERAKALVAKWKEMVARAGEEEENEQNDVEPNLVIETDYKEEEDQEEEEEEMPYAEDCKTQNNFNHIENETKSKHSSSSSSKEHSNKEHSNKDRGGKEHSNKEHSSKEHISKKSSKAKDDESKHSTKHKYSHKSKDRETSKNKSKDSHVVDDRENKQKHKSSKRRHESDDDSNKQHNKSHTKEHKHNSKSDSKNQQVKRKHEDDNHKSSKRKHTDSEDDDKQRLKDDKKHHKSHKREYDSEVESEQDEEMEDESEEETKVVEKVKKSSKSYTTTKDKHKNKSKDKKKYESDLDSEQEEEDYESEEEMKIDKKEVKKHSSKSHTTKEDKHKSKEKKNHTHESKSSHSAKDKNKQSSKDKTKLEKNDTKIKHSNKDHTSKTPSSSNNKSKKTGTEAGIGSGSGTSFAEALGMLEPSSSSKTIKKKPVAVPQSLADNDSSSQSSPEPPNLELNLLTEKKLEPLNLNISSLLPEITPNYKPLVYPLSDTGSSRSKINAEDETLSAIMYNKISRTKVYSGNKTAWGVVPSLFDLCTRVLQDNIDALEFTGGVPYSILKPVLERANYNQLFMLEQYNPYLMDDTDELWKIHCQRDFRNRSREEMETWRDMYQRCLDERESKLRALTANIKHAQDKSLPVRQTKMAYLDSVVKPPRNIARKQAKHGTGNTAAVNKKPVTTPSSRLVALATAGPAGEISVPNPGPRAASSTSTPIIPVKPKKAPLMQKTLALMKNRFRR